MAEHRFVLVGGDAALDFLNTVHDWTVEEPRDYLTDFAAAMRFGEEAGILSRGEARRLVGERAAGELRRLRELRASLERIVRATIAGESPPPDDLASLGREAAAAARGARLRPSRGALERTIGAETAGAAVLRARIVEAAVALLTSPSLVERVKSCPTCGWYFLDTSKNRSRRWCSMAACGSSAKARSYYRRRRKRASGV